MVPESDARSVAPTLHMLLNTADSHILHFLFKWPTSVGSEGYVIFLFCLSGRPVNLKAMYIFLFCLSDRLHRSEGYVIFLLCLSGRPVILKAMYIFSVLFN